MFEQIKHNFGYSTLFADFELRNRKLKKQYVPIPEVDNLKSSSATERMVTPVQIPAPTATVDWETTRVRQMRILSSRIFIDPKDNPINAYILFQGMLTGNTVSRLSDCMDGSVPLARLYLPSGPAEISAKRDVKSALVQVDVHEPHGTHNHQRLSELDISTLNCLMRGITSEIYETRRADYKVDGVSSESRIIKFDYIAEAEFNAREQYMAETNHHKKALMPATV